ncbi:MAG: spore coat U domain-containing protein [Beijerinckiaceae bacterium]|jgi:spore coat protein U-like protein|nr:spore coat U domain-containing protein [Beijerinckiaceae bacterium]
MRAVAALVFLLICFSTGSAWAQTCSASLGTTFAFGTTDVLANVNYDVTQNVTVSCTGLANRDVRVCLNLGDPNTGTVNGVRRALNGANLLTYQLYTNAGRTTKWSTWQNGGAGREVVLTLSAAGNATTTVPIYGRVFLGQQTVRPGTYTAIFSGTQTHLRARYVSTGQLCPAMTNGAVRWTTFTVSAVVPNRCLVTGNALAFGAVNALATQVDATTNLSVTCSTALPFNIGMGAGLNSLGPTARRMAAGGSFINYLVYRDAARTAVWGATIGTNTFSGTGTGATVSVPVYGRVPVQTTPPPGTYSDTVVITVTY